MMPHRSQPAHCRFSLTNGQAHSPASGRPITLALLLVVAGVVATFASPARAVDKDALRRKQDAQERAREMARQVVTGVLEIQLQQLEENGMKELPLYREIAGMKKNIGALVEKEMEKAVELLVQAQRGSEAEREQNFKQARVMIREIVMRLSAERQNLMRRLKSAGLPPRSNG